jgi:hypothetical protein
MSRHWLARIVICAWSINVTASAFLLPQSLIGQFMGVAGETAFWLVLLLGFLAGLGLMDAAINDLLPAQFTSVLGAYRHLGYMGIAIVLTVLGSGVAAISKVPAVLPWYLMPAMFAVVVTVLDLREKFMEGR